MTPALPKKLTLRDWKLQGYIRQFKRACFFEDGYSEEGGIHYVYLIVPPCKRTDEAKETYLLNNETFEIERKICGFTRANAKARNEKCRRKAGASTDHKGVGFCMTHGHRREAANRFHRMKIYREFKADVGSTDVLINAMETASLWPQDQLLNLENEIGLVSGIIHSMLSGLMKIDKVALKRAIEDGTVEETIMGMITFDKDTHASLLGWFKIKERLVSTHAMLQRDNSFSALEISRWLDEIKRELQKQRGVEFATEIIQLLASVRGLVDGNSGVRYSTKEIREKIPLGYANIVDAAYEDVSGEDKGSLKDNLAAAEEMKRRDRDAKSGR